MKKEIQTTEIKQSNIITEIKRSNINLTKIISKLNYLIEIVNKILIDLETLQVCPVYDDFFKLVGGRNSHHLVFNLLVNNQLCCLLKYVIGQTRHKRNHNNLLMINLCNKGNLLCRKLI
jgi:hypothetical protein